MTSSSWHPPPALVASFFLLLLVPTRQTAGCFSSIFGFGDSITDTGNFLLSSAGNPTPPVGHPPYGETFFHRPTGRYSDGRLIIDFIAKSLGLPFVRPYLAGKSDFRYGANFAVAGCTALNNDFFRSIGLQISWTDYSLQVQMEWFKQLLPSVCSSDSDCGVLMSNSLFIVGEIGGNDYNNALLQGLSIDEIKAFVPDVIAAIGSAIDELIQHGAETLIVPGDLPLGCLPIFLTQFQGGSEDDYEPGTGCVMFLHRFVEYHDRLLRRELDRLRRSHPHATIIYADYYNASMSIIRHPRLYGMREGPVVACCGGGGPFNYNASAMCGDETVATTVCSDPSRYFSWDGIHLTEAAYKIMARELFGQFMDRSSSQICPQISTNFSQLIFHNSV